MPRTIRIPPGNLFHEQSKGMLMQRLALIRPETEHRWGRMSAQQMVCHLGDAFGVAMAERRAYPVGGALEHTVFRWIALHTHCPGRRGRFEYA